MTGSKLGVQARCFYRHVLSNMSILRNTKAKYFKKKDLCTISTYDYMYIIGSCVCVSTHSQFILLHPMYVGYLNGFK